MDGLFPAKPLAKLGYVHQAIHGQKAYHGVAVLSRLPFSETGVQDFCREGHARHMGVTLRKRRWSCTISTCRRAATFPIPRRMTNSPTSCISWARWKNSSPRAQGAEAAIR